MTGVQAFINHQGDGTTKLSNESSVNSSVIEAEQDTCPWVKDAHISTVEDGEVPEEQSQPKMSHGVRPLQSTENDTLTSVIGMYQDGSHRG